MDEPQPNSSPTITLPIHEFLEILWGYKDKSVVEKSGVIANTLRAHPNEAIFHLEESSDKVLIIWRAKDWALSKEKHLKQKSESDKRVASWNLRNEIKEELKKLIKLKMGNVMGVSESFSENILTSYNIGLVLALGGTQDLCNKIMELQQKQN